MMSRTLMILTAAVSLSACVSLLPNPAPAPSVYRLDTRVEIASKAVTAEIIRVDRPTSPQIYNATDIIVTQDGQKLSTIAQAKWSEATPSVIQNAMIDALGSSSQFIGMSPMAGAQAKTRLHLEVKNFEASFDRGPTSAPLAVVHYRVTYARADDRSLIGTHLVRETMRASSINVSSIVSAIERANGAAMTDIVSWLEAQKGQSGS